MKKVVYFVMFCLLIACRGKSGSNENVLDGLIIVDWDKEYPTKEIPLQEIADVEYIQLETRPDVLLDSRAFNQTLMSDSLIITKNSNGDIFVFDRQGKNIYAFNHTGRDPEQYLKIGFMAADFAAEEIYISVYPSYQIIKVYAFDGEFKRTLTLPQNYELAQFFDYDEETLLGIDEHDIDHKIKAITNPRPYSLISKKDGKIMPVDLELKERVGSGLWLGSGWLNWRVVPVLKSGRECLISDFGSDTIYRLEDRVLTPFIVKRPSGAWNSNPSKVACVSLKTDRYVIIDYFEKREPQEGVSEDYRKLAYDRKTGEIFKCCLINQDYQPSLKVSLDQFFGNLPANYARLALSPSKLLQDYEAGKLTGKLKEVASRLDEDDNTVLMLIKFKQ